MAVTWFVATTGSDINGGSSDGAAKVSSAGGGGTGASWSSGVATVSLPAGTNLSAVVIGDSIRLATATGGIRSTDTFEITAVNDGADTVDVTPTPSNTVSDAAYAIGGSLATIQRALNLLRPSEKVWVKATGTYSETLTVASASFGTTSAPTEMEGFTSSTGDGGIVTISGRFAAVAGTYHWVFRNFRVTGSAADGWGFGSSANVVHFRRCRGDTHSGASSDGWHVGAGCTFVQCYAHDNGGNGFNVVGATVGTLCVNCVAYNNGSNGFVIANTGVCYRCVSFGNPSNNFDLDGAIAVCIDCTSDGDADDATVGFSFTNTSATNLTALVNCIAYDAASGVVSTNNRGASRVSFGNLVNANGVAYSNWATELGEVTGAPLFNNEGANDYGLALASPARSGAYDLRDNPWSLTFTGRDSDIGAITGPDGGSGGVGGVGYGILTGGRV